MACCGLHMRMSLLRQLFLVKQLPSSSLEKCPWTMRMGRLSLRYLFCWELLCQQLPEASGAAEALSQEGREGRDIGTGLGTKGGSEGYCCFAPWIFALHSGIGKPHCPSMSPVSRVMGANTVCFPGLAELQVLHEAWVLPLEDLIELLLGLPPFLLNKLQQNSVPL